MCRWLLLLLAGCGRLGFTELESADAPVLPDGIDATAMPLACNVPTRLSDAPAPGDVAIAASDETIIVVTRLSNADVQVERWRVGNAMAVPDGRAVFPLGLGPLYAATSETLTIIGADDATPMHSELVALDAALVDRPLAAIDVDLARIAIGVDGGYAIGAAASGLGGQRFIDAYGTGPRGIGSIDGGGWKALGITSIDNGVYTMHSHTSDPSCVVHLVDPWPTNSTYAAWGTVGVPCNAVDAAWNGTSYLAVQEMGSAPTQISSATISRDTTQVGTRRPLAMGSSPRLATATDTGFAVVFLDNAGSLAVMLLDDIGAPIGSVQIGPAAPAHYVIALGDGVPTAAYVTAFDVGMMRACP